MHAGFRACVLMQGLHVHEMQGMPVHEDEGKACSWRGGDAGAGQNITS